MGIFGGEKYSKEGYEEAEKESIFAERRYRQMGSLRGLSKSKAQRIYDALIADANKAKEKVEKIYGKGQQEAIALNKEYDRLLAKAQEALKVVAEFEREKLGMHKEEAEKAGADKK